tara:strand:- start:3833 stop:4342 length:510 start_codon:yes stop_codon:yes gene_type:complete
MEGYLKKIREELKINTDLKIKFTLLLFRLGGYFSHKKNFLSSVLYILLKITYKFWVEYFLGIELPINTKVGFGLKINHGVGIVINHQSIIGENVTLKHNVTIGCKTNQNNECTKHTIIGNNVIINPHSCVIGVTVSDNVIIGAGSIVVKDVEKNSIIAGNPAILIRKIK